MFYTIQIWVSYCLKEKRSDDDVVDDAATTTCIHGYKVKINTIEMRRAKLDLPHRTLISEVQKCFGPFWTRRSSFD